MLGFLLFGIGAVVFTLIFVTESSCAIESKEKSDIITRAVLGYSAIVLVLFLIICFLPDSIGVWLR